MQKAPPVWGSWQRNYSFRHLAMLDATSLKEGGFGKEVTDEGASFRDTLPSPSTSSVCSRWSQLPSPQGEGSGGAESSAVFQ